VTPLHSLLVSARVVLLALMLIVPLGGLSGYALARGRFVGRTILDALLTLPLVLPPSVVGYALLLTCGRKGPIGSVLERVLGIRLVYTSSGAALAAAVVALPLMAKGAESAFLRVDRRLEEVALCHGMSPWSTFCSITLPLAAPGLVIALTVATLRALGEFGATLVFAGYAPGQTDTAPLAIYVALQSGDDATARSLVLALAAVSSFAAIALARLGRTRRGGS
jgi:molybdate transport system permease protein